MKSKMYDAIMVGGGLQADLAPVLLKLWEANR